MKKYPYHVPYEAQGDPAYEAYFKDKEAAKKWKAKKAQWV